jgi:hypothetical protein
MLSKMGCTLEADAATPIPGCLSKDCTGRQVRGDGTSRKPRAGLTEISQAPSLLVHLHRF